jgi:hypothetical protein
VSVEVSGLKRGTQTRQFIAAIRRIYRDVEAITGERPQGVSPWGDSVTITWADDIRQTVKLAPLFAAGAEVRSGRLAGHRARRRDRERLKAHTHRATAVAAARARLSMSG